MANKLSDKVIAERMVELRNLRKLHDHDREQITKLKLENTQLKLENQELKTIIETHKIQIAELQTMVFGKKKRPPTGGTPVASIFNTSTKKLRTKDSYRRPIPPASAITTTEIIPIHHCTCGGVLVKITIHDRFEEDIPLPELTTDYQSKIITKYVISRGVCSVCGKANSGKDLGGQTVRLGSNVRLLVCHLVSVIGLSYSQTANLLLSLYDLHITDGEIAYILNKQHQVWLPAFEQLKTNIRAAPVVHVDETPWRIQKNNGLGYAWVLSDAGSDQVCYTLEQSRGAVYAKHLFGANTLNPFSGIRVSDDYGAYRSSSLPGKQQLCWAHLYRCIRDLRYNTNLPDDQLPYVTDFYEQFASIYQDLRCNLAQPYGKASRMAQAAKLWERVQALAGPTTQQPGLNTNEPHKLTRLKAQLLRAGKDKLFICLEKDTPCDNNRAERDLRQLVLKRKRSFGSQTEKGAKNLSTVLSICTTTWRTNPTGYFKALGEVGL